MKIIGTIVIVLLLAGGAYFYLSSQNDPVEKAREEYRVRANKVRQQVKEAKQRSAQYQPSQDEATDNEKFLDCPKVTSMLTPAFKATIIAWNDLVIGMKNMGEGERIKNLNQFLAQHGLPLAGWQGQGTWVSERHRCGALYISFYKAVKYGDLVFEAIKGELGNKWDKPAERPLADISNDQLLVRYKVKPLCLKSCPDCAEAFDVGLNITRNGRLRVINEPTKGRIVPADHCPVKPADNRPVICYEHEPTGRILVTTEACR